MPGERGQELIGVVTQRHAPTSRHAPCRALSRDGVGGSGDSLSGGARGQGGLADLAQVRARVPLSRRSDARRSDAHAAAVTRSHARSQAQPADTETDAFIHSQAATLPFDESGGVMHNV